MNPSNSQNDAKDRNWDRYHNNSDANLKPKNTKSIPVLNNNIDYNNNDDNTDNNNNN